MVVYLLFLPFIFIYLQTATIFGKNKPNLILIPTYICIFFFHSLHCDISYIKIFKFEFMWKSFTKTLIAENVLWYGCIFFYIQGGRNRWSRWSEATASPEIRIWKCKNISKLANLSGILFSCFAGNFTVPTPLGLKYLQYEVPEHKYYKIMK